MDGILNINKPAGKTSYDIVALVKKLSGVRRVGHAGTLDPIATGVLPVCLGQGTRVTEFLAEAHKTYQAEIQLGMVTDTYDVTGKVIQKNDPSGVTLAKLESTLTSFIGLIPQTPPLYSALKHKGRPLYQLAQAGITIERKNRPTQIYGIELLDWQAPVLTVKVECGKGTYIRSLAHDLGQALGCGGALKSLVRLNYGPFDVSNAISVPQLEAAFRYGYWKHFIHAADTVLLHWNTMIVDDAAEKKILNGAPITPKSQFSQPVATGTRCRAYTLDGCLLAVLHFNPEKGQWQVEKVFLQPPVSFKS